MKTHYEYCDATQQISQNYFLPIFEMMMLIYFPFKFNNCNNITSKILHTPIYTNLLSPTSWPITGGFAAEEIPQLVLLTFDDSANDLNKGLYTDLFEKGRTNPNGCPIAATFYVSHEWTDYSHVQNLYATGHEIASHSIS
jgi:hypothetical protein